MKCEYCDASEQSFGDGGYEWICKAGYDEPPIEFKDGCLGCLLRKKTIDKLCDVYVHCLDGRALPPILKEWYKRYEARRDSKL